MLCDFRTKRNRDEWVFLPKKSGKLKSPGFGEISGDHKIERCPQCNRRLQLKARYCVGGEFSHWEIPVHKIRETRKPSPRRKSRSSGRGK